jgi:hypothetical protein
MDLRKKIENIPSMDQIEILSATLFMQMTAYSVNSIIIPPIFHIGFEGNSSVMECKSIFEVKLVAVIRCK